VLVAGREQKTPGRHEHSSVRVPDSPFPIPDLMGSVLGRFGTHPAFVLLAFK